MPRGSKESYTNKQRRQANKIARGYQNRGVKISGGSNRAFVIAGDGELNEGTMWEGMLVAAAKKLDNLVHLRKPSAEGGRP